MVSGHLTVVEHSRREQTRVWHSDASRTSAATPTPISPRTCTTEYTATFYEMSNSVVDSVQAFAIIDSLPYYDNDLERDPSLKERAEKLIQRELKQQQQQGLHPRVPPPPTLFAVRTHSCSLYTVCFSPRLQNNPMLQAEIARVEAHEAIPPIDTSRYQLPGPTATPASEEDWQAALKNAHAQLEHQRLR
jgi:hypothetical protein